MDCAIQVPARPQMPIDPPSRPSRVDPLPAETTVELLHRAREGDDAALNRLLERCIPALRRWAHGRMPPSARGMLETSDLVQDVVIATIRRLEAFEPEHQGALQAYLRKAILNRMRDLARRRSRMPVHTELSEHLADDRPSPLEQAIGLDNLARYDAALQRLAAPDREAIVGRLELQQTYEELAIVLNKPTAAAARMSVTRAVKRLAKELCSAG
jgi:RNA polymerase sigma-70 factor, ECF subfamily